MFQLVICCNCCFRLVQIRLHAPSFMLCFNTHMWRCVSVIVSPQNWQSDGDGLKWAILQLEDWKWGHAVTSFSRSNFRPLPSLPWWHRLPLVLGQSLSGLPKSWRGHVSLMTANMMSGPYRFLGLHRPMAIRGIISLPFTYARWQDGCILGLGIFHTC